MPRADKITDGAHRFVAEDGQALGIIKEGKNYYIYDYASGNISFAQTKKDINKLLSDIQEQYGARDISAAVPNDTSAYDRMQSNAVASENGALKNNISQNQSADVNNKGENKRLTRINAEKMQVRDDVQYALKGISEDGRKMYESNFPKGTPKSAKSQRILSYIKNVWSKEPIKLTISNGETSKTIYARFDPTVDESQNVPTDASKIAGGNRHGNHTEQRVTLDLADDYYEIARDSEYNYSKLESGKDADTHKDVKMWHYFINEIYFAEQGSDEYVPYTVTINIKEKSNGKFVYSFNAEKEFSTRQTLHAGVNAHKGANGELFLNNIIPKNAAVVNKNSKNIVELKENSANKGESDAQTSRLDAVRPDKIHEYLRENVKGYKALSVPNQAMVRAIIRQGRILGIPDADLLLYAKVATRSGVNIVFDKEATYLGKNKDTGEDVYADGFYERGKNQITVNPEGTRSAERLLIHELAHAIFKTTDGAIIAVRGVKNLTKDEKDRITKNYAKLHKNLTESEILFKIMDEQNAHYAEGMLSDRAILERLVADKPTLKDKILNFFKGAATDYADDTKLSAEAKKLYRQYKKMFDEFSARNADTNAIERTVRGSKDDDTISFALMNKESLSDNVDKVMSMSDEEARRNKTEGNYISIMGETPSVITENIKDAENLEIIMRFDAFYLATRHDGVLDGHYHNYGGIMKKLPDIISDPEAIVRMDNGRLNLYTQIKTRKGNNSIISIELNTVKDINFSNDKYNLVVSVVPAMDNYARNNIAKRGVKVEYQKEDLLQVNPQLCKWLSTINNKSSNNSIPQNEQKSTQNSKKVDGKDYALPDGFDSDKVTVSRGELAKIKANYQGDKTFTLNGVQSALKGIEAWSSVPSQIRRGLENDLWRGYNMRLHAQGYELFTEVMYEKLCAVIQQENDFSLGHDEMAKLETQVADALHAIIEGGKPSEKAKLRNIVESDVKQEMEKLEQSAAYWRAQYNDLDKRAKVIGNLTNAAQSMKNLKLGIFANASEYKSDIFKGSIEKLSNIQWRGNVSVKSTRKIAADLLSWYSKENPLLEYVSDDNSGYFLEDIRSKLEGVANGQKAFTLSELKDLRDIMGYFTRLVKNYNKVFVDNKYVDALPLAKGFVEVADTNTEVGNVGPHNLFIRYMDSFGNPLSLMKLVDRYQDNGFNTFIFNTLQRAGLDAQIAEMKTLEDYEKFMREHKGYEGKLSETVEYRARKMTRAQLIGLYMTSKREQAQAGLIINGYTYVGADGNSIRVPGWTSEQNLNRDQLAQKVADIQREMEALLSADDKAYIEVVEAGFEAAKQMKIDRDMQRYGYTNALEGYYYPIRRANTAKSVDTSMKGEIERASNPSFNKDTVQGAKQELYIGGVDQVYLRHIHAMTQYSYLSPAIDTFNKLYNLDISGNKNKAVTVKTQTKEAWNYKGKDNTSGEHLGEKYFRKLIEDIQGISAYDEGGKLMAKMRGNYATFALGANPKVWLTQFSSLFASTSMLDYDSVVASFKMDAKDVDTYCSLAQLRNNDNTAAKAQGVVNKLNKTADILMKPIGGVDRYVIQRLFAACQIQVQKNGGGKVGTDANKIAAGELLERVILETQQNSLATERSGAMRSSSEFMKAITMFSADAMKVTGKVVDSYGEINAIDRRIKLLQKAQREGAKYLDETVLGETSTKPDSTTDKKISAGMTDVERYEVLKDRSISLSAYSNTVKLSEAQRKLEISNEDIEYSKYGDRVRLFKKLGDEFSVFGKYSNRDIKIDFNFSKENMRESVSKQRESYINLAKMLTCLDNVIDNAVGIEIHNRNVEGYKADSALKNVYVLASAFVDGENIIPVKLEVKEFSDKENTLHVAIALESIQKDGIVKQEVAKDGVARQYSPPSDISISEYFQKINPSDESFYKYIPEHFKNGEKASTSRTTIAEEIESLRNQKKAAGKQLGRKVQKIERPRS